MEVTGVVVSYDDAKLLQSSLSSIRGFYPGLRIILIDGSPKKSECREYIAEMNDPNIDKVLLGYNISHGAGLHVGISLSPTNWVLCFDTDIILEKAGVIEDMFALADDETLSIGKIYELHPRDWQVRIDREGKFKYVYPHFHLVNRSIYRRFLPYVHSGSPGNLHFLDVFNQKQEWRIKTFPLDDYVKHNQGGTSTKHPAEHRRNWLVQTNYFPVANG